MTTAAAIVPAAGRGRRMGEGPAKQYRLLGGRPVFWHTLARLQASPRIGRIIAAIHGDDEERFGRIASDPLLDKLQAPVIGGSTRSESVRAGLEALADEGLVLVHDAVRPWVSTDLIERVAAAAEEHGAAVPALPVTETIKVVDGGRVLESPDRRRLFRAQTPQGFRRSLLEAAFRSPPPGPPPTDEASMLERAGIPVHVVRGEEENVKITHPEDLRTAAEVRTGVGYDVHAFAAGRTLVLGGVTIPSDRGLAGHSDADVLTHAVIDALLGAAGLGDIGRLFPDDDPEYEGISSLVLLARVRDHLRALAAEVVNVDAVVLAQAPKLAPHARAMVEALGGALEIDPGRISVKATTTERLGFIGRQEGMAAQAVASVRL